MRRKTSWISFVPPVARIECDHTPVQRESESRLRSATDRLYQSLSIMLPEGLSARRDVNLDVAGSGSVTAPIVVTNDGTGAMRAVAATSPLTPDHFVDDGLRAMAGDSRVCTVHPPIDEFEVRWNFAGNYAGGASELQ